MIAAATEPATDRKPRNLPKSSSPAPAPMALRLFTSYLLDGFLREHQTGKWCRWAHEGSLPRVRATPAQKENLKSARPTALSRSGWIGSRGWSKPGSAAMPTLAAGARPGRRTRWRQRSRKAAAGAARSIALAGLAAAFALGRGNLVTRTDSLVCDPLCLCHHALVARVDGSESF